MDDKLVYGVEMEHTWDKSWEHINVSLGEFATSSAKTQARAQPLLCSAAVELYKATFAIMLLRLACLTKRHISSWSDLLSLLLVKLSMLSFCIAHVVS